MIVPTADHNDLEFLSLKRGLDGGVCANVADHRELITPVLRSGVPVWKEESEKEREGGRERAREGGKGREGERRGGKGREGEGRTLY